jgi:type II secretory pathway pseudopilin PulG
MIVITFFVVLSSIVLFNYRDFDDSAQLENESLGVALEIRDMQVRALSARAQVGDKDPSKFQYAHGVFFDRIVSTSSFLTYINNGLTTPTHYWFDDNFLSCTGECMIRHDLSMGYSISKICTTPSACTESASISFKRPNPDAIIKTADGGLDQGEILVEIMSPKGATSTVHVTKAGQIYVK